jgi:hypothetical protein
MRMQAYKEENIKESYIPERKPNPMIWFYEIIEHCE